MSWDGNKFKQQAPSPSPIVQCHMEVMTHAHKSFGKHITGKPLSAQQVSSCTDTGAQTCSSGPEILERLGCSDDILVPTRHRIKGITDTPLDISGALFLNISLGKYNTRQMVYISKNTKGFFLSESALKDLHLIPEDFPKSQFDSPSSSKSCNSNIAPCGCLKRGDVPPVPEKIPFPPTAENRERIEKWLLEYFADSAPISLFSA